MFSGTLTRKALAIHVGKTLAFSLACYALQESLATPAFIPVSSHPIYGKYVSSPSACPPSLPLWLLQLTD